VPPSGQLICGIDCSTQTTKALIVDVESGELVSWGRAHHKVTGHDGARETDPAIWWEALRDALGRPAARARSAPSPWPPSSTGWS
jgi:xylulokinase